MIILITGANGFIGQQLCDSLAREGHSVLWGIRRNAQRLHERIAGSNSTDEELFKACSDVNCLIHLAGEAHQYIKSKQTNQLRKKSDDFEFTKRLVLAANRAGVSRFIYLSSAKVYGEISKDRPFYETDICNTFEYYGKLKLDTERMLHSYEKNLSIGVVILRVPIVYGPNVKANFLSLLKLINSGAPLPFALIFNKRSFLFIKNLANAVSLCVTNPAAAGETFNVSDAPPISLQELIYSISAALGKHNPLFAMPKWLLFLVLKLIGQGHKINPLLHDFEIDSSKIRNSLGWKPAYTFEEGIAATADWYLRRDINNLAAGLEKIQSIKVCQICAVDFTLQHLLIPLVDAMKDRGWEVTCICSEGNYLEPLKLKGYLIKPVNISRNIYNVIGHIISIYKIYKICRKEGFDVIHVHTPIAALIGRVAGYLAQIPLVIHTAHGFYFHDEMPKWKYNIYVLLEAWAGRFTDYLFTQSNEDADTAIAKGIANKSKALAIGNGVDLEKYNPDSHNKRQIQALLGIPPGAFVIGVVSRFVKEKGLVELMDAVISLSENFTDVYLLMVGERLSSDHNASIETELISYKKKLGQQMILTGYQSDVPRLLSAMDIFCLASYREGMPRSVIEAMAMGLPVVATNIRGSREIVIEGETGFLVPTRDVEKLAKAIESLIVNPRLCIQMGQAGRKRVTAIYDERVVINKQLDVISSLL